MSHHSKDTAGLKIRLPQKEIVPPRRELGGRAAGAGMCARPSLRRSQRGQLRLGQTYPDSSGNEEVMCWNLILITDFMHNRGNPSRQMCELSTLNRRRPLCDGYRTIHIRYEETPTERGNAGVPCEQSSHKSIFDYELSPAPCHHQPAESCNDQA